MTPEVIYAFYAADMIGASLNLVDPRYSAEGIHDYITEVDSHLLICLNVVYDRCQQAAKRTNVNGCWWCPPPTPCRCIWPHRWATILYEFGGSLANENGGNLSSPESMNAINFTKGLFDDGLAVSSIWLSGEDANNLFRSGQVAVHISGTWMIQNYNENIKDFEWGVTYMPKGTTRSSVPGGKNITAFKGTGCEQEAVDFITWVTAKEQNESIAKIACMFLRVRTMPTLSTLFVQRNSLSLQTSWPTRSPQQVLIWVWQATLRLLLPICRITGLKC